MTNIYIHAYSTLYMQPPIGDATKSEVIEEYLRGKNRDPIASDLRLGTGTVSKIIKEWKSGLDYPNADDLRELVVRLRKIGISASRYAEGARIASYLVKLGINDEDFSQFVSKIYDSCKKIDLQPDKVAYLLKLLHEIPESVPPEQFQEYIELQKTQIQMSKEEIERLQLKIRDEKRNLAVALEEQGTTLDETNQFCSFKVVMRNNGITLGDSLRFVEAVVGAKKLGFNARLIVEKVSNLVNLERDQKSLEGSVKSLNEKVQELKRNCSNLEQEESAHNYSISIYKDLEKMGMGIKRLKLLLNTVAEIATANDISRDQATEKFFSDVQQQYDDKLGFEKKLQNLSSEIDKNEHMQHELSDKATKLNSVILEQFNHIQHVSGFAEFVPLVKAANGQKVPKNDMKGALIKAIEIFLSNWSTDNSTNILTNSKNLLRMQIQRNE
jgi:hypothetical protein